MAYKLKVSAVLLDPPKNCFQAVLDFSLPGKKSYCYEADDLEKKDVQTLCALLKFPTMKSMSYVVIQKGVHWNGLEKYNVLMRHHHAATDAIIVIEESHVKIVTGELSYMFSDEFKVKTHMKLYGTYIEDDTVFPEHLLPLIVLENGDRNRLYRDKYEMKYHRVKASPCMYRTRADKLDIDLKFLAAEKKKKVKRCVACLKEYQPSFFDVGTCTVSCALSSDKDFDLELKIPMKIVKMLKAKYRVLDHLNLSKDHFSCLYNLIPSILEELEFSLTKKPKEKCQALVLYKSCEIKKKYGYKYFKFDLKEKFSKEEEILKQVEVTIIKEEKKYIAERSLVLYQPVISKNDLCFSKHSNFDLKSKCEESFNERFKEFSYQEKDLQIVLFKENLYSKIKKIIEWKINQLMKMLKTYLLRRRIFLRVGLDENKKYCYLILFKTEYREILKKNLPSSLDITFLLKLVEECKEFLDDENERIAIRVNSYFVHLEEKGGFNNVRDVINFIKFNYDSELKIMRKKRRFPFPKKISDFDKIEIEDKNPCEIKIILQNNHVQEFFRKEEKFLKEISFEDVNLKVKETSKQTQDLLMESSFEELLKLTSMW